VVQIHDGRTTNVHVFVCSTWSGSRKAEVNMDVSEKALAGASNPASIEKLVVRHDS